MAKEKTRKVRIGFILIFAFILFIVYIGYHFITLQLQLNKDKNTLAQTKQKCTEMKEANDELNDILENDGEIDYIEKIAKDKLGYVNPDERVFIDISGN